MRAPARSGPLLAALWIATSATAAQARAAAPTSAPADSATAALTLRAREDDALERLAAISGEKGFYLVLEPDSSALTLQLQGAKLRRLRVEGLDVVAPALAFLPRHRREDAEIAAWLDRTWRDGELDPPRKRDRIEIAAPPPDPNRPEGSVEIPVPPSAEQAILVPDRYFLRFREGPVVEITAERPRLRSASSWEDRMAAAGLRPGDRWRIRLRLSAADADFLYRALPPAVAMLVWPEGAEVRP